MRDLSLILFLAVMLPVAFFYPMVGISLWVWVSIMNPHRMVYGFAFGQPFNQAIAIITILSFFIAAGSRKLHPNTFLISSCIFVLWCTLTTFTVAVAPSAYELWDRAIKTVLLVVLIQMAATKPTHVHTLAWVVVVSIGFHSAYGGIRTIVSAGASNITGPPGTQITDNNHFAVATIMAIPLLNYLRINTRSFLIKLGLWGQLALSSACVIGTYSRGGSISLVIALAGLWWRSKYKVLTIILAAALAGTIYSALPERYLTRISTISDAENDSSFQGRLDAWFVALNVANDYPLGTGFEGPQQKQVWDRYLPDAPNRAAHSIYFQVLGEQGWIGLGLFLFILLAVWRTTRRVVRIAGDNPEFKWAKDFAQMTAISLIAFCVGGAALSIAYLDMFLIIGGLIAATERIVAVQIAEAARSRKSAEQTEHFSSPVRRMPVAAQ